MKPLVAVILAGGVGKRFWPISADKLTVPFCGKPFIHHSVFDILPKQIESSVIITNKSNNDAIESMQGLPNASYIVQKEPLGMADAILTAKALLTNSRLFIVIADHIVDRSLFTQVLSKAAKTRAFAVLPGWKSDRYFPGGYFILDKERVLGILEKPEPGTQPSPYINITGHYIDDSNVLLDELEQTSSKYDDRYERAITTIASKKSIVMEPYTGVSGALKYPWHVLDINRLILSSIKTQHKGKNVSIGKGVIIEGNVYIEDDVKIFEYTKITGPSYIGKGSIIGNNCMIRESHIGERCVVGFNTDITRSYIGDDCWFHSNYIGDSVIEGNVSYGSGTVCANLRLDENEIRSASGGEKISSGKKKFGGVFGRNIRIGVNTSFMPGVKVGKGSRIGAGIVIDRDVPDGTYVSTIPNHDNRTYDHTRTTPNRDEFRNKLV